MRRNIDCIAGALSVVLVAVLCSGALEAQPPADLFSTVSVEELDLSPEQSAYLASLRSEPTSKNVQLVRMALAPATADVLNLNVAPDEALTMSTRQIEDRTAVDYSWFGSEPDADRDAIMVVRDDEMVGTIWSGDRLYRVRPLGGGLHAVVEVDKDRFPPDHPPGFESGPEDLGTAAVEPAPRAAADTGDTACSTYKVLVAYTPAARAGAGNVDAFIQLAIDETNQSYANSDTSPRAELVHSYETAYTESGSLVTDRDRFQVDGDGHMDEVHALRDAHRADVAVLLVETQEACGWASAILADKATAFAVVAQTCATGYYSFGHEIGHLQGARHNTQADPTSTPFPYGHGYYYLPGRWRTIMSYDCPGGGTRRWYWSNPEVLYDGVPMGTAATNDNARVLDETSCTIAGLQPDVERMLTLSPPLLRLKQGESGSLLAMVKDDAGAALPGATVELRSADAAVATVPAAVLTNAAGEARVTVRATAEGDTTITAEVVGASAQARVEVTPKSVPAASAWGLLVLAATTLLLLYRRQRRTVGGS